MLARFIDCLCLQKVTVRAQNATTANRPVDRSVWTASAIKSSWQERNRVDICHWCYHEPPDSERIAGALAASTAPTASDLPPAYTHTHIDWLAPVLRQSSDNVTEIMVPNDAMHRACLMKWPARPWWVHTQRALCQSVGHRAIGWSDSSN